MKNKILNIINNTNENQFCEEFTKNGFKFEIIAEDSEHFGYNVSWYNMFKVKKDNKEYSIYISGEAIAEISYDRWVDTYGYTFNENSISIEEIN